MPGDGALRVISNALKDNPRHAGLLAAQRRIEITLRQAWLEDALDLIAGANRLAKKVIDGKTAVIYRSWQKNIGATKKPPPFQARPS